MMPISLHRPHAITPSRPARVFLKVQKIFQDRPTDFYIHRLDAIDKDNADFARVARRYISFLFGARVFSSL